MRDKVAMFELFIVLQSHSCKQKAHGPEKWPEYKANESNVIKRIGKLVMYTKQRVDLPVPKTV